MDIDFVHASLARIDQINRALFFAKNPVVEIVNRVCAACDLSSRMHLASFSSPPIKNLSRPTILGFRLGSDSFKPPAVIAKWKPHLLNGFATNALESCHAEFNSIRLL